MRCFTSCFLFALPTISFVYGQLDYYVKKPKPVGPEKLYMGTMTDCNLLSNTLNVNTILREFGALTPEHSGTWHDTEPSRGNFNFACLDTFVDFAQTNKLLVRGHTFLWHSQLPSWVSSIGDGNTLTTAIQNHITQIATRYRGKIYSWEVVNEILNEDGSLRESVFSRRLGNNFVDVAFKAARAADPKAKLYINEYNIDSINSKLNGLVNLVNQKKAAGVPIDGIGSETHLSAGQAGTVQAALQKMASTGCDVAITELDIAGAPANDYATVVKACLKLPKCIGITLWGVSDRDSWRQGSNPLIFDSLYQKKPAYNAIMSAITQSNNS